ncbi:MAG: amidohydrolase family protein [Planctomycetota bacterium]
MRPIVSILVGTVLGALAEAPLAAADTPAAGAPGGPGLAIRCAKALVLSPDPADPQVIDGALVLLKGGKIEKVVAARGTDVPAGYELLDVGASWVMPGLIDLHSHEGGTYDINDAVYLTNPDLSARVAVVPNNDRFRVALAAGITTVLFIPGSATNMGGGGMLLKTGPDRYEEAVVRDPGSLKVAQWGNPESWGPGIGMAFENWNTRNTFRRGLAYAKRWEDFERGAGPEPKRDILFDIFRALRARTTQCSVHTQMYQVVLMTITMIRGELGLDVYLDHSTIGGWLTGELAAKMGVPAVVGPRQIDSTARGMINWARNKHEGVRGIAAGYQERGVEMLCFNTDAPVLPEESLPLQAAMGVRYGVDDSKLAAVRGLTVLPALVAGIADRVGSLTPGRDADVIVITGHPADPRSWVQRVFVDGKPKYDAEVEPRLW